MSQISKNMSDPLNILHYILTDFQIKLDLSFEVVNRYSKVYEL